MIFSLMLITGPKIQAFWIWVINNTQKYARCAHGPSNTPHAHGPTRFQAFTNTKMEGVVHLYLGACCRGLYCVGGNETGTFGTGVSAIPPQHIHTHTQTHTHTNTPSLPSCKGRDWDGLIIKFEATRFAYTKKPPALQKYKES